MLARFAAVHVLLLIALLLLAPACSPKRSTPPAPDLHAPVPLEKNSGLAHDPVEDDPRYAEVFRKIDGEVDELLADHPQRGSMGFVHIYWETKQRLLKTKYAIDWRTPAQMNPYVLFD